MKLLECQYLLVLRTFDELTEIIKNNPFINCDLKEVMTEIDNFYIFLFFQELLLSDLEAISLHKGNDNYRVEGRNVYVLFETSI